MSGLCQTSGIYAYSISMYVLFNVINHGDLLHSVEQSFFANLLSSFSRVAVLGDLVTRL